MIYKNKKGHSIAQALESYSRVTFLQDIPVASKCQIILELSVVHLIVFLGDDFMSHEPVFNWFDHIDVYGLIELRK